jgi:hypothetical protein
MTNQIGCIGCDARDGIVRGCPLHDKRFEMSPEEWAAYEGWCDADQERGLDDGGVQKRSLSGGFRAGLAYEREHGAKNEHLLDIYDRLLQEIASLQKKINELTEAIEETKHG